jgi:hypothetical protein
LSPEGKLVWLYTANNLVHALKMSSIFTPLNSDHHAIDLRTRAGLQGLLRLIALIDDANHGNAHASQLL